MVKDPGETAGTDTYQPVNSPEPVTVEVDAAGHPAALRIRRRQPVTSIEDRWRIDDEWWRGETVSRLYYAIRLGSGLPLVVYRDLTTNRWYRQAY
jgi:hypothetical protein